VLFDYRPESFADRQFQRAKVLRGFAELLSEQRPRFVIFDHIYSSWLIDAIESPGISLGYVAHDDMVAYADSLIGMKPGPLKKIRFMWLRSQYCALQTKILQRCDFLLTLTASDAALLENTCRGPTDVVPLYFDLPGFVREYPSNFEYLLVTGSFDTWEKQKGLGIFLEAVFYATASLFSRFAAGNCRPFSQRLTANAVLLPPSEGCELSFDKRNARHFPSGERWSSVGSSGLRTQDQNNRDGRRRLASGELGTWAGRHKARQWNELPSRAFNHPVYSAVGSFDI
jgi:hypothetical protein